ncbi:MAG: hypothetical protein H8D23_08660 [Candidatus Brocadiales bacterium]|nr:hypothetical protein [Candidatus Brocadiales bacterium]
MFGTRTHKITIPLFTTFLLLITLGSFFLYVEEERIKEKPALPGKVCQTKPLFNWTPQEKWVWNQICNGKIADFNERDKEYDKAFDPKNHKRKPKGRLLTPEFLETILLHEPFCGSLPLHGVRIVGAWFKDPIDLTNATLNHQLWLNKSRFDSDIDLSFLKTDYGISLYGSYFNGKLIMDAVNISGYLYMKDVEVFKKASLIGADIEGQFNMGGSKFTDELTMDSLHVGGYLFMNNNAEFTKEANLRNAKIGSALEMDGSRFKDKLDMQRLEVGNNLYMRYGAEFEDVILSRSEIGGNLELTGSTFNSIDLTGTSISREFRLSSKHIGKRTDAGPAKWREESKLTLLNTKIGVLQDSISSWPKYLKVELNGFTYDRLGNFIADNNKSLTERDITWFKKWMGKQVKYSPQPYEHLAKILSQEGRMKEAREILYTSKSREHRKTTEVWYRLWRTTLWIFIGYGYRIYYAFFWVLGLVTIGTVWLRVSKQYCKKDHNYKDLKYWGLAYSIDMLLPIIHLRKYHYDEIELEGRVRVYFYVHKILGYVLALFIITGLTGIVK